MSAINPISILFDTDGNPLSTISGSLSVTGSVSIVGPLTSIVTGSMYVTNFPATQRSTMS